MRFVDTHAHLDGEEFADDRREVMQRAMEAGVDKVLIPAIDVASTQTVLDTCNPSSAPRCAKWWWPSARWA